MHYSYAVRAEDYQLLAKRYLLASRCGWHAYAPVIVPNGLTRYNTFNTTPRNIANNQNILHPTV